MWKLCREVTLPSGVFAGDVDDGGEKDRVIQGQRFNSRSLSSTFVYNPP
jgi:hypothetical protein